jgi:hypothetical protein
MGHLATCAGDHLVASSDGWTRTGRMITRLYPAGFIEADYLLIQAGGTKLRLRSSDGVMGFAHPGWRQAMIQRDLDRLAIDRVDDHNVTCNAGRLVLLNFLARVGTPSGCQYFAVGNGSSVVTRSTDTVLVSEQFRKVFTSVTVGSNNVLFATFFGSSDANFPYTESGLFGNGASGTANTGTLFAHAIYNYANKTSATTLTNDYTLYES